MRKMKCFDIPGRSVFEVLEEFNERRDEFGVPDEDIVSISTMAPDSPVQILTPEGRRDAKVRVTIFYWSDE